MVTVVSPAQFPDGGPEGELAMARDARNSKTVPNREVMRILTMVYLI